MAFLNGLLRRFFDAALSPFSSLHPLWGLLLVSLLTAIFILVAIKKTSNQDGIAAVKRRIHACLFEIRLFNDDLGAILRAQLEILRHNLTYLRYSLVPMVWMLLPLALVIAQLQFHYGYHGLQVGERALVKVRLSGESEDGRRPAIELSSPPGLRQDSPALWIPRLNEVDWRIAAEQPGDYRLVILLNGDSYEKTVRVTDSVVRLSPARLEPGFLNQFLYPAEDPLPEGSLIESITVTYPDAELSIAGIGLHWLVYFFLLSIVFAFLLRKPFGVEL